MKGINLGHEFGVGLEEESEEALVARGLDLLEELPEELFEKVREQNVDDFSDEDKKQHFQSFWLVFLPLSLRGREIESPLLEGLFSLGARSSEVDFHILNSSIVLREVLRAA